MRTVKVLMLSVLRGREYSGLETPNCRSKTCTRAGIGHTRHNILSRHQISLRKFLISEEDPVPKLFGFSMSFDAKEYETAEKREIHISISLAGIRVCLSHLGYNDLDNHIKSPPRSHPSR
jgi:hypothetical protein